MSGGFLVVLYMMLSAYTQVSCEDFLKRWQCNLSSQKGYCFIGQRGSLRTFFLETKVTLGVLLLPCFLFSLFPLLVLCLSWSWEINLSIVEDLSTKNSMIFTLRWMSLQYYCFLSMFIVFFMIWSPISML